MGYSYSNIQLKAGGRPVDAAKIAEMLAAGHKLKKADSPEGADVVIAVGPENAGGWVTIVSDTFDQDLEACCKAAKALSEEYGTQAIAISCLDSDYLCLNLLDVQNNVDAWAASGKYPEGKAPRRSSLNAWEGYVTDVAAMRQVMRSYHSFAEECLDDLEDILGLPVSQGQCCVDDADPEKGFTCFYYAAEAAKSAEGMTVFKPSAFTGRGYGFKGVNLTSFVNYSGASRGVGVVFAGPGISQGNVAIPNMWIQIHDRRRSKCIPVELKEVTLKNGEKGLYGEAPEVRIRETVPDGLPMSKARELYWDRMIIVRYDAARKCAEDADPGTIQVCLIPLQNRAGAGVKPLYYEEGWG